MPEVGNEGKLANYIFFHEKKHENESCAVFRADIGGPDGKKPVKIAPAGPGPGRYP